MDVEYCLRDADSSPKSADVYVKCSYDLGEKFESVLSSSFCRILALNSDSVNGILAVGLEKDIFDYETDQLPLKVRNYVYLVLMHILQFYSTLSFYRDAIPNVLLHKLVNQTFERFFCYITERITKLGLLGYLQLLLEVNFMHEILCKWSDEETEAVVKAIKNFIAGLVVQQAVTESHKQSVTNLLLESLKNSSVMFSTPLQSK